MTNIINNINTELQEVLIKLAKSVIHNSSLTVDTVEGKHVLQENKIISIGIDKKCKIEVCDMLIYSLLRVYEQEGVFIFTDNLDSWQNAEKQLKTIKGDNWNLRNQFYQFMLKYIDAFYPQKLNSIILSGKLEVAMLLRALNATITLLHIPPANFYELIKAITETSHNLYGVIRQYCRSNYDNGYELLQLIIPDSHLSRNSLLIASMSGLLENNYTKAKELLFNMYDNESLKDQIIYAFTNCISVYPNKSSELYDKISSFPEQRCDATIKFYWEIWRISDNLQQQCEVRLFDIIDNSSEDLLTSFIEELMHINTVTDFVREYINRIIANDRFSIKYISTIDNSIADTVCDSLMLTDFVRAVSRFGLGVNNNMIENCIRSVSEKDPEGFANAVIMLITDNNGMIRHTGRKIWDSSNLINTSFNPLSLPVELQLNFIISMLQDFGNPKCRLKKVLPLFDASDSLVPQLLLRQLIPYVNNYMGSVMVELEALTLVNNIETIQLKEYFKNRCAFIDKRVACKELNPLYTQCKVLNEFKRSDHEYMRDIMKDAQEKSQSSILELFTPVLLAKGGGFRNSDGSVQDLAHISHSVPYPVMSASLNEMEESKLNSKIFANWDNVTDIWKIL